MDFYKSAVNFSLCAALLFEITAQILGDLWSSVEFD